MKKIYLATLAFLIVFQNFTNAQITYTDFTETFNSTTRPDGWESEFVDGNANWQFRGGSVDDTHPPFEAAEGDYNASFLFANNSVTKTKLITPELDFFSAIKPVLQFQLAQYLFVDEFGSGNTRLSIYFRSPEYNSNAWTHVKTIDEAIDDWELQEVLLPDTLAGNNSVQLAFEGWSSKIYEHGTCIDDIKIIETGVIPKYISSITSFQPSTDVVPTGSDNNPVLRLKIAVKGNDGLLELDSLVVNSLHDSELVTGDGDAKLFSTFSDRFNDTIPVGSGATFINGKATFDDIGFDLPIGNSYLWVTLDVPDDIDHSFKGKKLDASISANSIKINNDLYPSSDQNPGGSDGYRLVDESLFYDNFENDLFWNLSGEFEIDTASGIGGFRPEPDPSYAPSGRKVLGTDLTGQGSYPGDYERNLGSRAYIAEGDTTLYAKYFKDLKLGYYQWLNLYLKDSATIEISTDNGNKWQTIWRNTGGHVESLWSFKEIDLSDIADRKTEVKFRYTLGPTDISPYSGWNIDNFSITGTFVNDDAGFLSLLSPSQGCGHTGPEPISVRVKNYGYSPTNDTIPIGYSLDEGENWIMDTIFQVIARDDSVDFTFSDLIDISSPGEHNIQVKTFYIGDEDNRNDLMDTTIYSSPTLTLPYVENFEDNNGYWRPFGDVETWEYGIPDGETIDEANSGIKCWATKIDDLYEDSITAYLESPCIDFTSAVEPIFEFMLWGDVEEASDGLSLYYSLDEGTTWNFVPTDTDFSFDWNWYNAANIEALGTEGWDTVSNGWIKARQTLPADIAGENAVKFRFTFASNDTINADGFAIDDVRIYEAPLDAGVDSIIDPSDNCYLSKEQNITVSIKNYGIRSILPKDSLFTSVMLNGELALTDTFFVSEAIAINDTAQFTFENTLDLFDKEDYELVAYTHITGDTLFYEQVYNDTIADTITVYGEPNYSLGPDIGTLTPDAVVLDAGDDFATYLWKNHYNDTTHAFQTFDVPEFPGGVNAINFSVTIENDSGCVAYDTIKVTKSISDLGITSAIGVDDKCINKQDEFSLDVVVQNYSADTIYQIGDTLQVGYSFDDENMHIETITLAATLGQDETIGYSFDTIPAFPDSGSYSLKVFSVIYADLNYTNDTQYVDLSIYPLPEVDLGMDTIYTLDAISEIGAFDVTDDYLLSYLWQDASFDPTFTLSTNKSATYYVEVADTNSCSTASDTARIISDNWVLDSIISPVNSCILTENEQVSIRITNESPNTYAAGFKIPVVLQFADSITYDTISLTEEIESSESFAYTFAPEFDLSAKGEFEIIANINPYLDNGQNDNQTEELLEIWGIFPVEIGPDTIITRRADSILLDAGDIYDTYLWQDGSTNSTYNIPYKNSYQYSVTVTDENGCSNSSDEIQIMSYDIGVAELITPESSCDLGTSEKIKLSIYNYGPDDLPANEDLSFFYQINDGSWTEVTHTMSVNVESDKTSTIVLFETIPFESDETYEMKITSRWAEDFFYGNDTISKVIYQYDSPEVELGEDIYTTQADTVVLDGGEGQTTYTWQDGTNERYFNVTNPSTQEYDILVTNSFGCQDRDTVNIITYDIEVDSILPLTTCDNSLSTNVSVQIKLNSQDTLLAGEQITATYDFNSTEISETITLASDLTYGVILDYTFTENLVIADTGNYSISCSVEMTDEVDVSNNSKSLDFRVGAHLVNLGEDIVTYEDSVILNAGSRFETYLWSTDETSQTIEVRDPGKYKVTVSDVNSCSSSDSINILFLNPSYEITEILGFSNDCTHDELIPVTFTLKNTGNDTVYADSTIDIEYYVNWGAIIEEEYTFASNFEPNDEVTVTFNNQTDISETASHLLRVTAYFGELSTQLDTMVETWGNPIVELGEDIVTYEDSVILDAGAGYANYLWNTEAETQTIEVRSSGKYKVTVTNEHECSTIDSINVLFLNPSYEITEIVGITDACEHNDPVQISFILKNTGNDTIPADSTILTEMWYGTGMPSPLDYTFTEKFTPGDEVTIGSFEHDFSFGPWEYLLRAFAYMDESGESVVTRDSIINTFGLPSVDLGEDISTEENEITLDAGEGFESYLWNTDETTQEITVIENGDYWVEVSDTNMCSNRDTVNVYFIPVALKINLFSSPEMGCEQIIDEDVKIRIKNTGTKIIPAGTEITLGYQLEEESRVDEPISFAADMEPEDHLFYTFNQSLTINESGTFDIKTFIGYEETDVDTADYEIIIHEKPEFFNGNDTIKVEGFPFELDPNVTAETYVWNTGDETQIITVNTNDWYILTITQTNTCQFTDSVYVKNLVGIFDDWGKQVNIYPNPTRDKVIIETGSMKKNTIIQITDVNGQIVYRKNKIQETIEINTNTWNSGIYIIQLYNEKNHAIYQLIKQ